MSAGALLAAAAGVSAAAAIIELAGEAAATGGRSMTGAAAAGAGHASSGLATGGGAVGGPDAGGVAAPARGRRVIDALAALGRRAGLPLSPSADLAARLDAAGLSARIAAGDVMAVKAGGALVALLATLPLAAAMPGRLGPVMVLATPAGAFLAPDAWLARRARGRARVMAVEAADVLDLLRVAVAAGLPVGRALGEVGRRRGGLLAGELAATADRLALGVPRARALGLLLRRCPLPAVAALVAALGRADRHGAPLAPALQALAADARAERTRRLQDRAARAAPKIQLVVALLLVPAVMLLVGAALVSALA